MRSAASVATHFLDHDPLDEPRTSALVFFASTDATERLARCWAAITLMIAVTAIAVSSCVNPGL